MDDDETFVDAALRVLSGSETASESLARTIVFWAGAFVGVVGDGTPPLTVEGESAPVNPSALPADFTGSASSV